MSQRGSDPALVVPPIVAGLAFGYNEKPFGIEWRKIREGSISAPEARILAARLLFLADQIDGAASPPEPGSAGSV